MRPFETLDRVATPEGGELTLHRRGEDLFIQLDGEELMSTRVHGSESALAELAAAELAGVARPRVLIGGLGLGFTLRAALAAFPPSSAIAVAELFPAVVEWQRRYLEGAGAAIDDPRVAVLQQDVVRVVEAAGAGAWDAILLDVDNGPSAWCLESNNRLYTQRGLARLRRALAPRGALAVWSAYRDDAFLTRLGRAGFRARMESVRGRGHKGPRQAVFVARVGGAPG